MTENQTICDAPFIVTTPRFLERGVRDGEKKTRRNIPKGARFDVMSRDGFRCRYCGRTQASGATLHVDHVKPVAAGGGNEIGNLVTACSDCNLGKSAKRLPGMEAVPGVKPPGTFGLSFNDDGGCHWQFVIEDMDDRGATLTTFSWLDGSDHSREFVTRDYLRDRCVIFANHDVFLEQANYWGDAFADRRNLRFKRATSQ